MAFSRATSMEKYAMDEVSSVTEASRSASPLLPPAVPSKRQSSAKQYHERGGLGAGGRTQGGRKLGRQPLRHRSQEVRRGTKSRERRPSRVEPVRVRKQRVAHPGEDPHGDIAVPSRAHGGGQTLRGAHGHVEVRAPWMMRAGQRTARA